MLYWALVFFVITVIAALFSFTGVAVVAVGIAQFLFFLSLALFGVFLLLGLAGRRHLTPPL